MKPLMFFHSEFKHLKMFSVNRRIAAENVTFAYFISSLKQRKQQIYIEWDEFSDCKTQILV